MDIRKQGEYLPFRETAQIMYNTYWTPTYENGASCFKVDRIAYDTNTKHEPSMAWTADFQVTFARSEETNPCHAID